MAWTILGVQKKMNIWGGGGGYEEIVDIFWGSLHNWTNLRSHLYTILGFFFGHDTEWTYFFSFFFWGGSQNFKYLFGNA